MLNVAENAVKLALERGATEAEAFVYEGQATNVGIELGQSSKSSRIIDRGLGIRVSFDKAIGFSYTNIMEKQTAIEDTITKALSAAKASKPDQDWHGLPEKKPYALQEGTYDPRIFELRSEDLVNVASTMLDAATEADKRVFPIEGGAGAAYLSNALANSNGIMAFDKGTGIECSLATVVKEAKARTRVCFEFNAERNYNIDPAWVGKEAARLAISATKTKRIETKTTKLILTQFALQELLYFTLINAVKADNIQRNQSPFKGKIGTNVASDGLNIYDDGFLRGGLPQPRFGGEGTPRQKDASYKKGS